MEFWLWVRLYSHMIRDKYPVLFNHIHLIPPPLTDVLSHPPAPLDDYTEGSAEVSFSSTTVDQMECVTVTASDDELVEGLETFTIALASVSSATLVIDTEMNTTTVTILDADCECAACN